MVESELRDIIRTIDNMDSISRDLAQRPLGGGGRG